MKCGCTSKKLEFSKKVTLLIVLVSFIVTQECFALMYLCIKNGFTATAAWLTAAVGLAEALAGLGINGYLGLAKANNTEGGITFEAAKAKNFVEHSVESPPI